jgi:hypothetical protein
MYSTEQLDALGALIEEQFQKLAGQLSEPLGAGDSCFVTTPLPTWLREGLEFILAVRWMEPQGGREGAFLLSMDVHFGDYYRRMELTSGTDAALRAFASEAPPARNIAMAIMDLMAMERDGR